MIDKSNYPRTIIETIDVEYVMYYPGDIIKAVSSRSSLKKDKLYTVTEFSKPYVPHELQGIIFVEGERIGFGVEGVILVTPFNEVEDATNS